MEISIKVPALVTLVVLVTGMVFGTGYVCGRAGIPLEDFRILDVQRQSSN